MRQRTLAFHTRQLGVSLIEVLVAVAIGMIGILIITQAYLAGESFNRATVGEGGAQTNGLIALYTLERDARMSGYGFNDSTSLGCGALNWYHSAVGLSVKAGGPLRDITLAPFIIVADTVTPANPDKLEILYSTDNERSLKVALSGFNGGTNSITLGVDGFRANDYLVLVKAGSCSLVKATTVTTGTQTINLATTSPNNPANLSGFPAYALDDGVVNLGVAAFRIYSIGNGRLRLDDTLLATGVETPVDLIDGMVDLRALYGKDTNADNVVDRYDVTTPATAAEWIQVQSVKIAILTRVGNYEKGTGGGDCEATTAVPVWSGSAVAGQVAVANPFRAVSVTAGSQDRCYRYRVFETTIPLRNMIWRAS